MIEHGKDYERQGFPPAKQAERLPQMMEAATTVGRHIGYVSKRKDRPVMATYMNDEQRIVRNGMTIGNNGFIVGMNPLRKERVRRKAGDPEEVSERTMEKLYYYPPNVPDRRSTYDVQASEPSEAQPPLKHSTNKW